MFGSIKRLYTRVSGKLQRRTAVKDSIGGDVRYTTGEHCNYNTDPVEGSTKSYKKLIPGSRRRRRQYVNSPGILRLGKPLPTPYSAVILSDEDINLPCSPMTVAQLRAKLASLGADPLSRVPVDEEGGVIEEMEFEAMNYEAINDEEMPEDIAQESGYTEDAKLTEEQVVDRWLRTFIGGNYNFNVVYAWVCAGGWRASGRRPGYWHQSLCHAAGNAQAERHVRATESDSGAVYRSIENPIGTWPRRIWDVCANRVIPFEWIAAGGAGDFWAISHAWTDDMRSTWTEANQHQWPVPLPQGVRLEDIRKELVGMNARYCWLDVLCLRQEHPDDAEAEKIRLDEWELDVPTVGIVFVHAKRVVTYFNGLGRQFNPEKLGTDSSRNWINRAWTMQETVSTQDMIVAGLPQGMNKPFEIDIGNNTLLGSYINTLATMLGRTLPVDTDIPYELMDPEIQDMHLRSFRINSSIQLDSSTFSTILLEMGRRQTLNPVDKVAALMYLLLNGLHSSHLPVYLPSETAAAAWGSSTHWFPSWEQVMKYPDVSITETQDGPQSAGNTLSSIPTTRLGCGRLVRNCTLTWNRFTELTPSAEKAGKYTYTLTSPYYESTTVWVSADAFPNGPTQIPDGVYTTFIPREPNSDGHEPLPWIVLCHEVRRAELIRSSGDGGGEEGYVSADEDQEEGDDQYPGMRVYLKKIATVRWDHVGGCLLLKRMFDLGDGEGSKHEVWLY
ncbi:hypothetical protein BGX38DRAFT_1166268 [Terfezia claveryi]|nr:hypothetical protein BGX38DRAFT_1166268 [Terfezia claveryi]